MASQLAEGCLAVGGNVHWRGGKGGESSVLSCKGSGVFEGGGVRQCACRVMLVSVKERTVL